MNECSLPVPLRENYFEIGRQSEPGNEPLWASPPEAQELIAAAVEGIDCNERRRDDDCQEGGSAKQIYHGVSN